jgi:hypothetical protein
METGYRKEVHLYDHNTGVFIRTYPSQGSLEKDNGLYRGAVGDYLNGRGNFRVLVSRQKYDIHPDFSNGNSAETFSEPQIISPLKLNTLSEDDLRKKHDMFYMISSFIKGIPDGRYVEEPVMLRQLGLMGKPRYREALSRAELKDNRGKVDGVIYYGSISSIKKLKNEGVLQ